jgi:hypothetical protein
LNGGALAHAASAVAAATPANHSTEIYWFVRSGAAAAVAEYFE